VGRKVDQLSLKNRKLLISQTTYCKRRVRIPQWKSMAFALRTNFLN
jgi:hypothetical protein